MDEQHRKAVADMWGLGNYQQLADQMRPAAEQLAKVIGEGEGRRALDAAAGTGSVAIALAQRGWLVDALDIAPTLIAQGRKLTHTLGLAVDWHEAPLDTLPFPDGSFDLIASSFGLIFAPDPQVALAEARRCLRPDGRLVFTAWTPEGYIGQMTELMMNYLPPLPKDAVSQMDWGRPEVVAEWLKEAGFVVDSSQVGTVHWKFDGPAAGAEFLFKHSPVHVASVAMAADRAPAMIEAVREHLVGYVVGGEAQPISIAADYTLTIASLGY